jgi:hypothetical protein
MYEFFHETCQSGIALDMALLTGFAGIIASARGPDAVEVQITGCAARTGSPLGVGITLMQRAL